MSNTPEEAVPEDSTTTKRPTLNSAVLRRRADQAFYLRLREAIIKNHRALERLGR